MILFEPHPGPQFRFMEFGGRYALIGGAAFGGKSECLRWYPWKQIRVEMERKRRGEIAASVGRSIIFRRTMPELREIMDRCHRDFRQIDPGATWKEAEHTWTLSCGYKYMVAHMEDAKDWIKYYGFEYTFIGWDELTTFTEEQYDQLDTRLRSKDPVLQHMLWNRAGTNPVGPGLEWVRRRFVECAPAGRVVVRRINIPANDNGVAQVVERRQIFIPAKVDDNLSVDGAAYKATLLSKGATSTIVRQLLHGDWWVVHGAWIDDLWDPGVHVCKPFKIPKSWPRFRSCDYGYKNWASVDWYAVDPDGNLVCYRNLTVKRHNAEMLAYRIKEIEMDNDEWDVQRGCSRLTGPLDYESFGERGHVGPTIAETMFNVGVQWDRCDKNRHAAADQIRRRLVSRSAHPTAVDKETGKPLMNVPGIKWFDTCLFPIRTIPALPADEGDPEVPDTKANDHNWDSLAYACLSRPVHADKDKPLQDWWDDTDELASARRKQRAPSSLGYRGIGRKYGLK